MALLEPTNLLLLACALVYALIGEPADGAVLLVFVLAIVVLDGLQRHRSDRAWRSWPASPLPGSGAQGRCGTGPGRR